MGANEDGPGTALLLIFCSIADAEAHANYSSAKHTPDNSTNQFWTNFLWVLLILSLLTTPTCYYLPCTVRRRVDPWPATAEVAGKPLLAVPLPVTHSV